MKSSVQRPTHAQYLGGELVASGFPRMSACACLLLIACFAPACSKQEAKTAPATSGTVTVDAKVSAGSRFIAYANDVWAKPIMLQAVPDQWHEYRFEVPATVTSFRLDPSELPGVSAEIRHVRFELPGQSPHALPLTDLPKWVKYNCDVVYDPATKTSTVKSTGPNMYFMSTVDINIMIRE
jgi:hypothetical protein